MAYGNRQRARAAYKEQYKERGSRDDQYEGS